MNIQETRKKGPGQMNQNILTSSSTTAGRAGATSEVPISHLTVDLHVLYVYMRACVCACTHIYTHTHTHNV